jgi:hypothetical protein
MKSFKIFTAIFVSALLLTSCFKDTEILFTKTQIEFESAVILARATGEIFPIVSLTRASGTPPYQVNLVGRQLALAEQINFSVEEVPDRLLNATTIRAVEGVHYNLNGGSFSFPENASKVDFTGLSIIPDFLAESGKTALLIIRLEGNDNIQPSENFRRLAFRISLNP